MSAARDRAATAWGVTPAVVTPPEPDAPSPPFGTAWEQFAASSAEQLRAALRLDERQRLAEQISGGVVRYPSSVERPWVRAMQDGDGER